MANVLVYTAMALNYGISMPMMYPLCLLGIAETYFREMILLRYHYKKPPIYDLRVTLVANQILQWVAILSLPFITY